jgi:outer membrane lipoprotein-sorting protein
LSLFNEPLRSEGYFCFQNPGRIRWQTTSPYQSILVSDGVGVARFEWLDVMAGRYTDGRGGYAITVTNTAGEVVVTLVPRNEGLRRVMAAIEVHLAEELNGARRVVLRENGGDYTDIRFDEQHVNLALPPKTFDRGAPADIGKIQSAAAGAKP